MQDWSLSSCFRFGMLGNLPSCLIIVISIIIIIMISSSSSSMCIIIIIMFGFRLFQELAVCLSVCVWWPHDLSLSASVGILGFWRQDTHRFVSASFLHAEIKERLRLDSARFDKDGNDGITKCHELITHRKPLCLHY